MFKIIIWSGHHSREIFQLIEATYNSDNCLLVLCPPRLKDITPWLAQLPSGLVEFAGDLEGNKSFVHTSKVLYPSKPSFGLFSTGTVGSAKLILYTRKNFEASIEGIFSFFKDLKITTIFSYPQPYHVFGLALGYLTAIVMKMDLIFPEGSYSKVSHESWLKCSEENGAHLLTLGTPTHFLDAMSFCTERGLTPKASLTAIAGGARVDKNLWHKLQTDLKIAKPSIGYGCSEASPGITHLAPGLEPSIDGDLGMILPNGKILQVTQGLIFRGENVCLAIINNGTVHFLKGELLLPDLLELDESQHYHFKNRLGLVLNRGGEKFNLEDIEAQISSHFHLKCMAIAVDDQRLGQELGLLFVGKEEQKEFILKYLSHTFKRSFSADLIMWTEELPLNANAKYDRITALKLITGKKV